MCVDRCNPETCSLDIARSLMARRPISVDYDRRFRETLCTETKSVIRGTV